LLIVQLFRFDFAPYVKQGIPLTGKISRGEFSIMESWRPNLEEILPRHQDSARGVFQERRQRQAAKIHRRSSFVDTPLSGLTALAETGN